jgi:cyclic beta-1,2-glucan synthetase
MYRAAVEAILGVERRGDSLTVRPRIPGHWPGYEATLHIEGTRLDLVVCRGDRPGMAVDDKALPDGEGVPLDGKPHRIVVTIGGGSGAAV